MDHLQVFSIMCSTEIPKSIRIRTLFPKAKKVRCRTETVSYMASCIWSKTPENIKMSSS